MRVVTCLTALLILVAVASAASVGGTTSKGKSASFSNSKEKVQVTMESGVSGSSSGSAEASSAASDGAGGAGAAGPAGGKNIVINMGKSSSDEDEEDGEKPCTDNCDAETSESPTVSGPMHYSQPLGDLEGNYAPVRGSQTEAIPTQWTSPLGDTESSGLPDLPAPDAAEAEADHNSPAPTNTHVDTPVVSKAHTSKLDEYKNALEAKRAQAAMSHKAQLNANIAHAQDSLQYISKAQRELRYQYSELQLKHAGLRGQVQAAQLELAKLNKERPSFPNSANNIDPLTPSLDQDHNLKILAQPHDNLEEKTEHSRDKVIMGLLHQIVDKLDGKIPKEDKEEKPAQQKK